MDIQPVSGHVPHAAASAGESITDLAHQHGVSRESLLEFLRSKVQQTREDSGQPPLDQGTLDQVIGHMLDHGGAQPAAGEVEQAAPAGYTSHARSAPQRAAGAGSISVFA